LLASFRAEAVVTRRQLFPPNPSVKPSVIFFGPHHEGTADFFADADVFADVDVATTSVTSPHRSANTRNAPPLLGVIVRVLPFLSMIASGRE
jgi:hypothetical protein